MVIIFEVFFLTQPFLRLQIIGLEDEAHVLEVNGEIFNAVLGMVDITRGTNSYYKLQVLKKDDSKRLADCRNGRK